MKKRNFYLNIDEDKVLMDSISFDEQTEMPIETLLTNMFNSLSLSPSVIDISSLNYIPHVGDIWDGENFVGDDGISTTEKPTIGVEHATFSFTINNSHSFYYVYPGDEMSNIFIAALKSNPTITFEDTDD